MDTMVDIMPVVACKIVACQIAVDTQWPWQAFHTGQREHVSQYSCCSAGHSGSKHAR